MNLVKTKKIKNLLKNLDFGKFSKGGGGVIPPISGWGGGGVVVLLPHFQNGNWFADPWPQYNAISVHNL